MGISVRPARILAALFLLTSGTAHAAPVTSYTVTALEPLSNVYNAAFGINDNGLIVGQAVNSATGLVEAVVWSGGTVQSLGFQGVARAVNNNGTVVGETGIAVVQVPNGRAFSWNNGVYTDLGDLGGAHSGAYDINDSGQITGFAFSNPDPNPPNPAVHYAHAFIYENGSMTDLGSVSTPLGYSRGHGINDAGEIAGRASLVEFSNSDKYMASWDASGVITSYPAGFTYNTAQQINNNGLIVGNGFNANGQDRAMVWDQGVLSILGSLGGGTSRAWSVNDAGVIVGLSTDASGTTQAMVSFDGQTLDQLSTLVDDMTGWSALNVAYDINELGQIVGVGTSSAGELHAYLLTPNVVPIPGALWLFGSGLGLLGWLRRRSA